MLMNATIVEEMHPITPMMIISHKAILSQIGMVLRRR